jgi:probable F420-dependent oxidoreductase
VAVEELGFDSLWVSDHIIVPEGESYIAEDMFEPLALLAWLAGRTERVLLGTSVLVLPYRDPVFLAKHLASIDVLSGGRLVVGVGVGWLEQEFGALGAPYADRGAMTDEYLSVLRNLWETDTSSFDGRWKQYAGMRMFPKRDASRTASIPLVVGGNTGSAIRRAARLGDGWHPINLDPAELAAGVARYRAACDAAGRAPGPVILRCMPTGRTRPDGRPWPLTGSTEESAAELRAFTDAGCDEIMLSRWASTMDKLLERLATFSYEVVPASDAL